MESKAYYLDLIDRLRNLSSDLERIGCLGFDLKTSNIITESAAFEIATGIDHGIRILNAAVESCRHAIDIVDGLPNCPKLSTAEKQLIQCAAELTNTSDC